MKALILLLAASMSQAQPAFTITIDAGQTVVTAKSPIEVHVTLKNASNHEFRFYLDNSRKAELSGFDVEVSDPQGLAPKITKYNDLLTGEKAPRARVANPDEHFVIVGSGGAQPIAPGGTIELHMDVGQMYDLSKPGVYTVQVTHTDAADGVTVKSNPLKITVTE